MKLKVKKLFMDAGDLYVVVLNSKTLKKYALHPLDRIDIIKGKSRLTCIINVGDKIVKENEIGVYLEVYKKMKLRDGESVEIELQEQPKSLMYIREKIQGKTLDYKKIYEIVKDTVNRDLTESEISAFLTALEIHKITMEENEYLSRAMIETGNKINWGKKRIFDKHSLGGIPGKKESLLIVPIVAAAGLTIPKTSSRAVSSASGTADTMESIANVEFTLDEIKRIVKKHGGCIVWGGSVDLSPADDIFIQVEHPLEIDPMFLPSIMSKKKSVGSTDVVIDIPMGREAKVKTISSAHTLAREFIELGRRLSMRVRCAITYGEQPIGHAIGPALEAREALETLMGNGPNSLIQKAIGLSSIIFDMAGKKKPMKLAEYILKSGKAEKKFREIVGAQGGDPKLKPKDIHIGEKKFDVISKKSGTVFWIRNFQLTELARTLGAPKDKGAGIYLYKKKGYKVKKGEKLFTMFSESEAKLDNALEKLKKMEPVVVRERISQEIIMDVIKEVKR
ncbi:MAG: AMP phosphorylase [Candidatus Aenigmarchaeota archaeon]|nr:AMP phosphorylase [Candidatus Aenigmarchaeota archaeon]